MGKKVDVADRTTLQDIAVHCGLSRSTVARVLNGNAGNFRIAAKTIEKVQQAAKQLNYRPNRLARAVNDRRTHLIGISVPRTPVGDSLMERQQANTHRINGVIFSAITQHPLFKKYDLVMHNRDEKAERPFEDDGMQRDLLDGVIYSTPSEKHNSFLKSVNAEIPLVLMGDARELHASIICVDVDNRKMARQATGHLLAIGRRKIMMLVPEDVVHVLAIRDRMAGFREAMEEAGLPVNPDLARIIQPEESTVREFIISSPAIEQADALLCLTDNLAMLCMDPLEERGLRIPEEIALMGFNGTDLFSEKAARLSTVKIPFHEMAYQATGKLLEVLEGEKPYAPGFYEIPTELIIRDSTVKGSGWNGAKRGDRFPVPG